MHFNKHRLCNYAKFVYAFGVTPYRTHTTDPLVACITSSGHCWADIGEQGCHRALVEHMALHAAWPAAQNLGFCFFLSTQFCPGDQHLICPLSQCLMEKITSKGCKLTPTTLCAQLPQPCLEQGYYLRYLGGRCWPGRDVRHMLPRAGLPGPRGNPVYGSRGHAVRGGMRELPSA